MKLILFVYISILYFPPSESFAQERVTNQIVRTLQSVFTIQSLDKKNTYSLKKDGKGSYQLVTELKGPVTLSKIANSTGDALDIELSDQFLTMKYMMPVFKKKCSSTYLLSLRGEALQICKADNERVQIVKKIINKITKEM